MRRFTVWDIEQLREVDRRVAHCDTTLHAANGQIEVCLGSVELPLDGGQFGKFCREVPYLGTSNQWHTQSPGQFPCPIDFLPHAGRRRAVVCLKEPIPLQCMVREPLCPLFALPFLRLDSCGHRRRGLGR